MKNSFLMRAFVCLFAVVALCSCNKDDDEEPTSTLADNTITAKVENGNSYNDRIGDVKAVIGSIYGPHSTAVVIARTTYSNGGFTLELPETVSDAYLDAFDADFLDEVTVSNPNVKTGDITIFAYKLGEETGNFYQTTPYFYQSTSSESDDWRVEYMYSNGDVSITGIEIEYYDYNSDGDHDDDLDNIIMKYNMHLKKGWNIVYLYYGNDDEYEYEKTTQKPSVTLKWYLEDYYHQIIL